MLDLAVRVDHDKAALVGPVLLDVHVVGASDRALGLEVSQQIEVDAEMLLKCLVAERGVDRDAVELRARFAQWSHRILLRADTLRRHATGSVRRQPPATVWTCLRSSSSFSSLSLDQTGK